ncbi:MAG: NAD(P)-dependent oxidoreductase [Caldilineaceae bacterium]|nr:NAD(P)-dependent oxidoreductase [Caldilineaceae bacterium]
MKILVTGGLGFVGINLVRFLADQPSAAVVVADLTAMDEIASSFLQPVADSLIHVRLNIVDREAVRALIEDQQITHIVHAAAITATDEQEAAAPTRIVDVNLGGTVNVLDAAMTVSSVQRVINVSSSGVYSVDSARLPSPLPEDGPLEMNNLYAITKYSGELLTTRYAALSGKPMTSVRLASVYGPMERTSDSRSRTSLMHRVYTACSAGKPIRVAGPHVSRDWVHAEDVARAVWMLLNAPQWRYPAYNISTGVPTTFAELVAQFAVHGLQAEWIDDPSAADIVQHAHNTRIPLDIQRLVEETGFRAQIELSQGIKTMISIYD